MAMVVFLRGVNVGGHRTFRPSVLAREMKQFEVVNIGAAGTFVVRQPGAEAKFRVELRKRLPFEAEAMICQGREVLRLEKENPFAGEKAGDETRFVMVLAKGARVPKLPITLPEDGPWLVRVMAAKGRFVFGAYRRDMKTIGCLGKLDKIFGAKATTRNWKTMMEVARVLKQ